MLPQRLTVLLATLVVASAAPARGHFLWIVPDPSPKEPRVHVCFSETAAPDDPTLLSRLTGLKVEQVSFDGKQQLLEPTRDKDSLVAIPVGTAPARTYGLTYTYGLHSRDGETYLLVYHARMYTAGSKNRWNAPPADHRLPLEIAPSMVDGKLTVHALWQGKPLPGADVKADPAGRERIEGTTGKSGEFSVAASQPGLYAFLVKHVEPTPGERDGKKYASIRHYSTLVVVIGDNRPDQAAVGKVAPHKSRQIRSKMVNTSSKTTTAHGPTGMLPDLPFAVTSFGAAVVDQKVYVCGGHLGPAHEYSQNGESERLLRLDLRSPRQWETIGSVPRRAGLAMVAYGGKLYRIGGFEARNKEGETADLHSTADFARFDPASRRWEDLPSLPQARSSHDAVMVGSRLIVVGGWNLRGSEPSIWHDTALWADLSLARPVWNELPKPPFRRRALALGEYQGKVYALGGMQEQEGPTTTVYVLDLTTGNWSQGPKLPGEGLQGFGGSAIDCAGRLYATTYSGELSCLSADGKEWRGAGQLTRARFFHRLLCSGDSSLIALGGGNMEEGKDPSVEVVHLAGSQ